MEDPDQDPPGRYPPASCSLIGVQPLFSQFSDMCPFHLRVCSVPGKFCLQLLPAWLPSPGPSGLSLNVERRQLTAVSETGQPTPYFFLLLPFLFLYSRSHNLSSCVSLVYVHLLHYLESPLTARFLSLSLHLQGLAGSICGLSQYPHGYLSLRQWSPE